LAGGTGVGSEGACAMLFELVSCRPESGGLGYGGPDTALKYLNAMT